MVDVRPTLSTSGAAIRGVTLDLTGEACVGTVVGAWITGIDEFIVDGFAVHYDEDGGTGMSAAVLTFQVQVGGEATAYAVQLPGLGPLAYTITTDASDVYIPLWPISATVGAFIGGGLNAIRATAVITGTGALTDALKVTIGGRRR